MARVLKNILLLLSSVIVLVIILELGVRLFIPSMGDLNAPRSVSPLPTSFTPDPGQSPKSEQYDSFVGWVNKPGVSGFSYGPDNRVSPLKINSRGLRDRDIGYQKPAGVKRIVVLGDSFAWGYGLKTEERFSDILGRDFPDTQVINMGVVGYSTDQECTLFEREGIKYGPDLIILLVHDTDIFHNGLKANYGKAKPYFTLRGDTLERHGIPVPRLDDSSPDQETEKKITAADSGEDGILYFIKHRVLSHSRLYTFLSGRLKMIEPLRRALVKIKLVEPERPVSEDVHLTGAIIERLQEKAAETGGKLLVLMVPSKEVINFHLPAGAGKKFLIKLKDAEIIRREEAVRELVSRLRQAGIPVIDLTASFIEASSSGTNLYFIHDNHWNEKANEIAAQQIGAFLRQNGYQ